MPESGYPIDHRLSDRDANIHSVWDNSLEPILTVAPGDVVRFECQDATGGQLNLQSDAIEFASVDFDPIHPLTGPVFVEGAEPGDILVIDILDVQHKGWGYTGIFPKEMGLGLLPEEYEEPAVYMWDLVGDVGRYVRGIEVPLAPFPGTVGLAPAETGRHATLPPRNVGGNMDIKHLTAGSTLYLPVAVEGGLVSIGDGHAAQGDGEVCVTGIEAPVFVTARFDVRSDFTIDQPQFTTNGPFTPTGRDEIMYATTGISDDLMEATKLAVRHMIEHLHEGHGLSRPEAYMLCSAIVDLKINEVVDQPNWVVSAYLPQSIFPDEP